MQEIGLWTIDDSNGQIRATPANAVRSTETEEKLEELLVASPDLLMPGLTLVGRQLETEGGPLDLLGVDEDGRLVVFELKKGTLTRDAVAQVVDYTSDLFVQGATYVTNLVEEQSDGNGIDRIDDFVEWHTRQHPGASEALDEPPRMILVGLGVDGRALRMVEFLAKSGVDIELITFQAFVSDGQLFLARQVERSRQKSPSGGMTKNQKAAILREEARKRGVGELMEQVAGFFRKQFAAAYENTGKESYSYALTEQTEAGRPSLRVYIRIDLWSSPTNLAIVLYERASEGIREELLMLRDEHPDRIVKNEKYNETVFHITETNWPAVSEELKTVLPRILDHWRDKKDATHPASHEAE